MRLAGMITLACALSLPACSLPPAAAPRPTTDRVLTFEAAPQTGSALDLLRRHRPAWLNTRGVTARPSGEGGVAVYVDGVREPRGVAALRSIDGTAVARIERLSAAQAQMRFGAGHTSGALIVTLGTLPGPWTR